MATNWTPPGRDYPTRDEVQRQQAEEARDQRDRDRREDKANDYLRDHPSASLAEAYYRTRK